MKVHPFCQPASQGMTHITVLKSLQFSLANILPDKSQIMVSSFSKVLSLRIFKCKLVFSFIFTFACFLPLNFHVFMLVLLTLLAPAQNQWTVLLQSAQVQDWCITALSNVTTCNCCFHPRNRSNRTIRTY